MLRNWILLFCVFFALKSSSQVLINEYSAANYAAYTDNYGEYEDWVELYNPTANPIDLNGWFLTDKTANPTKWSFTSSFIIPANGTVIVFCSGRDEVVGGNAHSNFKITQTKLNETLLLSDINMVFQDSVNVIPHQDSHSRGRETDGSTNWSVFANGGTPNSSNINALEEYATTPVFSQSSGYYSGSISVSLSSPDSNVTIYYTTNGDSPDNTSTVFTTPININNTTVLKAIAYSSNPNIPPSFIDYHTFFINDTHTIPILSISGDSVALLIEDGVLSTGGGWWGGTALEPRGTIEWFDQNGVLIDKGTGEFISTEMILGLRPKRI